MAPYIPKARRKGPIIRRARARPWLEKLDDIPGPQTDAEVALRNDALAAALRGDQDSPALQDWTDRTRRHLARLDHRKVKP